MNARSSTSASEGRYTLSEKTSETDDQRIQDVTPLPPPEHLIRFFPIAGTPVEKLIGHTRNAIRQHHAAQGRPAAGDHRPVFDPRPGRGARVRAAPEAAARRSTPTRWKW